jgi:hypothetical protein
VNAAADRGANPRADAGRLDVADVPEEVVADRRWRIGVLTPNSVTI